MDNITHSLAGLLIAECLVQKKEYREKRPVWFVSILSNNFPDIDFIYSGITGGGLGYLLHHRGHTHTIVGGILAGLLIYFLSLRFTGASRKSLFVVSMLGPWAHIFLDSLNSYGVHPFWPFSNRWVYLDTLFIIEPWLWVVLFPYFILKSKGLVRLGLSATFLLLAAVVVVLRGVPWPILFAMVGTVTLFFYLKSFRWTVTGAVGVVAIFMGFSFYVRKETETLITAHGEKVHALVVNPLPGDPFCFSLLSATVKVSRPQDYYLRRGAYLFFPDRLPLSSCDRLQISEPNTPLEPSQIPSQGNFVWFGEWRGELDLFRKLAGHCGFRAFLRFSRAPKFERKANQIVVSDFRFERRRAPSFASFVFEEPPKSCPAYVPPWEPPLQSLIK